MESGQAPPPSYQAGPDIPSDIFQPLLAIAQRQYDPNDVKQYYHTMLRHLRRMGTINADAAYNVMTPVSDRKTSLAPSEPQSLRTIATHSEDHVSPKTMPTFDEPSFEPSYEPGQSDQLQIATSSAQVYPVLNESCRQAPVEIPTTQPMLIGANYSPPNGSRMPPPTNGVHVRAASVDQIPYGIPQQQPLPQQWFSPETFGTEEVPPHLPPRFAPSFSPSPQPYNATVVNGHIPMINPFAPPPPQQQYYQPEYQPEQEDFLGSISNSLGISNFTRDLYNSSYYPMIDVIPSRKKGRKALQKGVRRITQGIPLPRQSL
jgi:hypothetical protein